MATDEIKVRAEDFKSQGIDSLRTKCAFEAWLSLITTCKGTALEIVQSADSPSASWRELLQRYRACGLKEKSRLMREFNSLKMKLGEDTNKFIVRVDRVAQELRRVGKAVDEDDKNLTILNEPTEHYTVQWQILEGGDDEPTQAHVEKVLLNPYDRLRAKHPRLSRRRLQSRQHRQTTSPSPLPQTLNGGSSALPLMTSGPNA